MTVLIDGRRKYSSNVQGGPKSKPVSRIIIKS